MDDFDEASYAMPQLLVSHFTNVSICVPVVELGPCGYPGPSATATDLYDPWEFLGTTQPAASGEG